MATSTPSAAGIRPGAPTTGLPTSRPNQALPNGAVAMLIFIATEIMFFSGLISAFTISKAGASGWPPIGQPRLPVETTAFNTAVLLASGIVLFLAGRAFAASASGARAKQLLGISFALGAFFVVFQGYEWVRLVSYGLTMRSSTYGSFFYLIVGAHALHAVAALLALAYCAKKISTAELTRSRFLTTQLFWYFVVGLWPVLYLRVYVL